MHSSDLVDAAELVAARLSARDQTVAVAESSAGGVISSALVAVAGASAYYAGGFVVYTRDRAEGVLADVVPVDAGVRSASEPFAAWLAQAAASKLGADWGLGETGASGPAGNRYGDPAGHAWLAVAGPGGSSRTEHALTGSDDRRENMETFAVRALRLLAEALDS